MADEREFSTKRQIIDYSHLVNLGDEHSIICVPNRAIAIARKLLVERGQWRSSYSLGFTSDDTYQIPTFAEMDIVTEAIAEFLSETGEYEVSICDDLITGVNSLTSAVQNLDLSCTCGGSGSGACAEGSGEAGPTAEPPTTNEDDGENPPPGFSTYTEYQDFKCNMAEKIRLELIEDMNWLKAGTIVTITAQAAAIALFTPIPGDELVFLIGVAVSYLVQGILVVLADEIITSLGTNQEAFRCDLYSSLDVSEALTVATDSLGLSTGAALLFGAFLSTDSFNRLFENEEIGDFGVDCSVCGPPGIILPLGTTVDDLVPDQVININSELVSGFHRIYIRLDDDVCPDTPYDIDVHTNTATGTPVQTSGRSYDWGVCPAQTAGPDVDILPPALYPLKAGVSQITSVAAFTMSVTFVTV